MEKVVEGVTSPEFSNKHERLLAYSAAILTSLIQQQREDRFDTPEWMIDRSINVAKSLIEKVYATEL